MKIFVVWRPSSQFLLQTWMSFKIQSRPNKPTFMQQFPTGNTKKWFHVDTEKNHLEKICLQKYVCKLSTKFTYFEDHNITFSL